MFVCLFVRSKLPVSPHTVLPYCVAFFGAFIPFRLVHTDTRRNEHLDGRLCCRDFRLLRIAAVAVAEVQDATSASTTAATARV